MPKPRFLLTLSAMALCAGLLAAPAHAQQSSAASGPVPTAVEQTVQAVAIVETVDLKTREVLLTLPNGQNVTVVAGPQVQNLDKVKSGDQLVLTMQQAVGVQLSKPGGALPPPSAEGGFARARKGELPAGASYTLVDVHVKIDAVDNATHQVSFTRADGSTGKITVHNPAMQQFASQLKPGDNVELQYLEAVSLQVQSPSS